MQHNGSNAHWAKLAQDILPTNCSEFIDKDKWPPNSPYLNPLDYHVWGAMLERYKTFHSKPKNIEELKNVMLVIWDQLASSLNQQGHSELHKKNLSLFENRG